MTFDVNISMLCRTKIIKKLGIDYYLSPHHVHLASNERLYLSRQICEHMNFVAISMWYILEIGHYRFRFALFHVYESH